MSWPSLRENIAFAIGLAGFAVAIYVSFLNGPRVELSYESATRYAVKSNNWGLEAAIDGKPVPNNIFETLLIITNTGNTVLDANNIRGDHRISAIIGGNVLKYKLESKSLGVVNLRGLLKGAEIFIDFEKFDPGARIYIRAVTQLNGLLGDPVINSFGESGRNIVNFNVQASYEQISASRRYFITTFMIAVGFAVMVLASKLMQGQGLIAKIMIGIAGFVLGVLFVTSIGIVVSNFVNDKDNLARSEIEVFRANRIEFGL